MKNKFCSLQVYDHEDTKPRANQGRCLKLLHEMLHDGYVKKPEDVKFSDVLERTKMRIYELLNEKELNGEFEVVRTDDYWKQLYGFREGIYQDRMNVDMEKIKSEVQAIIDQVTTESRGGELHVR